MEGLIEMVLPIMHLSVGLVETQFKDIEKLVSSDGAGLVTKD